MRVISTLLLAAVVQAVTELKINFGGGMHQLGKYCYGYVDEHQKEEYAGFIDLSLSYGASGVGSDTANIPPDMKVAIFDDQESSWGAVTSDMSCQQQLAKAKHSFDISWGQTDCPAGQLGCWIMPAVDLEEHQIQREWFVYLVACGHKFSNVTADLKFTPGSGVYSQFTGPTKCKPEVDKVPEVILTVFLIFFIGTTICLGSLAFYFTKRTARLRNRLPAGLPDYDAPAIEAQAM